MKFPEVIFGNPIRFPRIYLLALHLVWQQQWLLHQGVQQEGRSGLDTQEIPEVNQICKLIAF